MRILWIVNTIFPEPSKALGQSVPVEGGWMYGLAEQLIANREISLAVAAVYQGNKLKCLYINNIYYYLLPSSLSQGYQKHLEPLWKEICSEYIPDIVHIHGTEYNHGLAFMRACKTQNIVVSIQGLVAIYARYYYAGVTLSELIKNITIRDLFRKDTVFHGKNKFGVRGLFEKEYISLTKHVIGRTRWDYVHSKAINSSVTYHYCNEILRNSFYTSEKWDYKNKTDYTIFLSQASYPIKGFHKVLKAVALLIQSYPMIMLRVAGHNILNTSTLIGRLKINGYASYITKLIKKLRLEDHILFTGPLSEENMIKEYLNAHLFICPSSIENSPNSVGESQILGVPTIASYVGGIPDMINHGEAGLLYRFEEVEMLAENIRQIFTDKELARHLSENGIKAAEQRHNQKVNCDQTINIYRTILLNHSSIEE